MGGFSLDIGAFAELAKGNIDKIVRKSALQIFSQIIMASPVGNPDLWQANAEQSARRETYNDTVGAYNEGLLTKRGKMRTKSAKALRAAFPNVAGKGYIGGRFRGNWVTTLDTPSSQVSETIDPSGRQSIGQAREAIGVAQAGQVIYMSNNLPYAQGLENGNSTQAPSGMVAIAVMDFQNAVDQAAREVKT